MKRRAEPQAPFASPADYMAAFFAIFVVGLAIRLFGLGAESLWWGEVYAVTTMAHPGLLEIIRLSSTDNNPPLSYLILHCWIGLRPR